MKKRKQLLTPLLVGTVTLTTFMCWQRVNHAEPLAESLNTHIDTHATFGKTHFIVGQTAEQAAQQRQPVPPQPSNAHVVYFSPEDNIRAIMQELIAQDHATISLAVFAFTDPALAQALIAAHKRGVRVEVITDPASLRDRNNKIGLLSTEGVSVFVYNAQGGNKGRSSTMHHKFLVLSGASHRTPSVVTGSFNFTRSACDSNQENIVIVTDPSVVERFDTQFNKIKQLCYRYTPLKK
jgi:phosphatidylserine/phosphatidylglycerophosphate/cardiolipin synthase-like enzyme